MMEMDYWGGDECGFWFRANLLSMAWGCSDRRGEGRVPNMKWYGAGGPTALPIGLQGAGSREKGALEHQQS